MDCINICRKVILCCSLGFLVSCASVPAEQTGLSPGEPGAGVEVADSGVAAEPLAPNFFREPPEEEAEPIAEEPQSSITKGTGKFLGESNGDKQDKRFGRGRITLNFNGASMNEFIRVVFEKILRKSYLVDPRVKGSVTLHTTKPVREDAILSIMESVLQQNGAALIFQQGIYKVIPLQDAPGMVDSPGIGNRPTQRAGYAIQIVPLRYVSAKEIEKVITPMLPNGGSLRIDEARNLLILTASRYRLEQMLDTVRIFDVDWFKGMSFGLFRLQYAEAGTLVQDLESLMRGGGNSPLNGIVRLVPIERLNAILVVTHSAEYLDRINKLINKFDWGIEGTPGRRLFVYHLKNSKAEALAAVLQQIYEIGDDKKTPPQSPRAAQLPPGERDNVSQPTRALNTDLPTSLGTTSPPVAETAAPTQPGASATPSDGAPSAPAGTDQSIDAVVGINVIAEPDSNSLLVMARPQDYRGIESVIKQLDVAPRQVLIEATIAEVTLSDSLAYGVRWFLAGGTSELGLNAPVPGGAGGDGLTFATFSTSDEARGFIDLLASKTAVNFLSAPQVMVLDNKRASIRVGDQIPVTVRNSQSTGDGNSPVVSEVQFRDTGTLLAVTPRINAGGQITLEISQEVSLPGSEPSVGGGGNVAISQRTIESSVVVQSGETVLLGGLILESKNESRSGIPLLMDIPYLGNLFSSTSDVTFRTELIIMITPRVIQSESAMRAVIEEVRGKMKRAIEYGNSIESIDL